MGRVYIYIYIKFVSSLFISIILKYGTINWQTECSNELEMCQFVPENMAQLTDK